MRTTFFAILVLAITIAQSGSGAAQGPPQQAVGDPANGKAVFAFGVALCTVWFIASIGMTPPPATPTQS